MKFRLFQTLLITAIIVTWGETLQAISIKNNTNFSILVFKGNSILLQVNPHTHTTANWSYTGTLSACIGYDDPEDPDSWCSSNSASCSVSPSVQLTVNPTGNQPTSNINVSCTSG